MAVSKKCDICGKYYDPVNSGSANWIAFCKLKDVSYSILNTLDCCDDCLEAVQNFIKERGEINTDGGKL